MNVFSFVNIENFTPILYDDDLTMMTQLVNRYTTILPFLEHGGKLAVRLSGKQRNKGIGLEIPATYTFQLHRKLFGSRLKRLPFLSSRVMIGFYRYTYIGVNFKFELQDCDRCIGDH